MRILFLSLLATTLSIPAQSQKGFIKLSPTLLLPKDQSATFLGTMSLGFSAGRYTTVAASFGYYKFEGSDGPVLPIGLDFSFMDLGAQKISPYINIAGYFPYYDVVENTSRPGMNSSISTNGVYLFKFGGGIACTLVKGKKLIFSGGYAPSQFKYKSRVTVVSGTSTHTNTSTGNIKTQNYYASMEFFL